MAMRGYRTSCFLDIHVHVLVHSADQEELVMHQRVDLASIRLPCPRRFFAIYSTHTPQTTFSKDKLNCIRILKRHQYEERRVMVKFEKW